MRNSIMARIKQSHNYLNYNILLLKCALIWPVDNKFFRTLHKIVQYATAFILLAVSIGQFMAIFKTNDLRLISSTVDVFTLTATAIYKQLFIAWNITSMRHIVNVIHNDFYETPLVENGGKKTKQFRMLHHLRFAKICSRIHFLSAIVLTVIWCFAPLLVKPQCDLNSNSVGNHLIRNRTTEMNRTITMQIENQKIPDEITSATSSSRNDDVHKHVDTGDYLLFVRFPVKFIDIANKEKESSKNIAGQRQYHVENHKNILNKTKGNGNIENYFESRNIGDKTEINKELVRNNFDEINETPSKFGLETENLDVEEMKRDIICEQIDDEREAMRNKRKREKYTSLKQRRILPMNVWTGSFSYINTPWYETMFAIQFWAMLTSCTIYLAIDTFYFCTLYILCGQLQLIYISMQNMFPLDGDDQPAGEDSEGGKNRRRNQMRLTNERDNARLCKIAQLHAHVLRLVRFLEQTFTSSIIVDFLHAVTSLSFALFHFQTAEGLVEFTKMYVFLIICILHQFLNNYFGELIKYWQMQISYATYETPWYLRDGQFKRTMQMITARTRQPIMMNGLKMYVLCLASFIEFMKRIFSYYTVLREIST